MKRQHASTDHLLMLRSHEVIDQYEWLRLSAWPSPLLLAKGRSLWFDLKDDS